MYEHQTTLDASVQPSMLSAWPQSDEVFPVAYKRSLVFLDRPVVVKKVMYTVVFTVTWLIERHHLLSGS